MSAFSIDTAAARRRGGSLVDEGDRWSADAAAVRELAERLRLGWAGVPARRAIELAAERAWSAGTLLRLASDAAERADVPLAGEVAEMVAVTEGRATTPSFGSLLDHLSGWSPRAGDLGGTGDAELRSPYVGVGRDRLDRGRNLIARALADTADLGQIRPDEFEIVELRNDRYVVVLPGVIDLSSPHLWFDDDHRSVRDLDQVAATSAWSSSVADNRYAQMVWEEIRAAGVPAGASLLLVGHSFGADTAVDLAADRRFNGEEFRVTHVVAAGYHVDPLVPDVDPSTEVLVVQNRRDVAVIGEAVGHSQTFATAVTAVAGPLLAGVVLPGALVLDGIDSATARARDITVGPVLAAAEIGNWALHRHDALVELATGAVLSDHDDVASAAVELVTMRPGVRSIGSNAVVDVFDGGAAGFGHRQSNYIDHLTTTTEPAVVEFLASLDDAGYAGVGTAIAIDISVPRRD